MRGRWSLTALAMLVWAFTVVAQEPENRSPLSDSRNFTADIADGREGSGDAEAGFQERPCLSNVEAIWRATDPGKTAPEMLDWIAAEANEAGMLPRAVHLDGARAVVTVDTDARFGARQLAPEGYRFIGGIHHDPRSAWIGAGGVGHSARIARLDPVTGTITPFGFFVSFTASRDGMVHAGWFGSRLTIITGARTTVIEPKFVIERIYHRPAAIRVVGWPVESNAYLPEAVRVQVGAVAVRDYAFDGTLLRDTALDLNGRVASDLEDGDDSFFIVDARDGVQHLVSLLGMSPPRARSLEADKRFTIVGVANDQVVLRNGNHGSLRFTDRYSLADARNVNVELCSGGGASPREAQKPAAGPARVDRVIAGIDDELLVQAFVPGHKGQRLFTVASNGAALVEFVGLTTEATKSWSWRVERWNEVICVTLPGYDVVLYPYVKM